MKTLCASLFVALLAASTASAQAPAAAHAAPADVPGPAATAQSTEGGPVLGRLFFTPEERARLDELHRRPPPDSRTAAVKPEEAPARPTPEYVTVNGIVRRSDGVSTVWVNDKPVQGGASAEGIVVAPARGSAADVVVRLPESGRSVGLKVGQQLEVTSGEVHESYRARRAPLPPGTAVASTAAEPAASSPMPARRGTSRQRDLLRDLLEEIDRPDAKRTEEAKQPATRAPAMR